MVSLAPMPLAAFNGPVTPTVQPAEISAQLMTITPQMAAELLRNRPANRPIAKARIRAMMEDMRAGRWSTNGESIILDAELRLLDGQHRLLAVQESGVTITALVAVGVEGSAMPTIDQGARRSGADTLAASSIPRARDMAAVARWLWRLEHAQMRMQAVPLRNQDLPAFVAGHPGVHATLGWGSALQPILPASCAAACYYHFSRHDSGLAKTYYLALKSGEGLEAGHPALAVRDRAFKERVTSMRHAVAVARAAVLVLGWNCLRADKPCPQGLAWKGERDASVPFPRIL